MEPITTAIIAAIGAGALKSAGLVSENAIADGYAGLKALILRKFNKQGGVAEAVEAVETKPDSEGRRHTLQEEIVAARVDHDSEIVEAAKALLGLIATLPTGEKHIQNAVGSFIAQADRQSTAQVIVHQPHDPKS